MNPLLNNNSATFKDSPSKLPYKQNKQIKNRSNLRVLTFKIQRTRFMGYQTLQLPKITILLVKMPNIILCKKKKMKMLIHKHLYKFKWAFGITFWNSLSKYWVFKLQIISSSVGLVINVFSYASNNHFKSSFNKTGSTYLRVIFTHKSLKNQNLTNTQTTKYLMITTSNNTSTYKILITFKTQRKYP